MTIQYLLELLGTFFFAVSGARTNPEKEQDWFGASFIGFITAIGGGSLRDILLGSYPLVWIGDINFLYAILIGVAFSKLFFNFLFKIKRTLLAFDTLGISFFTIVGAEKAQSMGVQPEIAAMMGMFTAVMGGVIRDTLTNEIPVIFRKEIYASACLFGAICYLALDHFYDPRTPNFLISAGVIVFIRYLAVKYQLALPSFGSRKKGA